ALPVVELDRHGTQLAVPDGRHPDGRVLRDVVVDDEIERDAAARSRDARGREVLYPDTRMEQLGLMTRDDEWDMKEIGVGRSRDARDLCQPMAAEELAGQADDLAAGLPAEARDRSALDVIVPI